MTLLERDPANLSPLERALLDFPPALRSRAIGEALAMLPHDTREAIQYAWYEVLARPSQRMPEGRWHNWMLRAGRGFGKSRCGSEAIRRLVNQGKARAITLVGKTPAEARDVMVEGPVGILAVHPPDVRPKYESTNRRIEFVNGAVAHVRSAADPDSIRGLNSDLIWFDEPASMRYGKESWDNAVLGNRLGEPHAILTGTPRPLPWLRDIEKQARTVVTVGSTYENLANLADSYREIILERYEGTRLGAQELHARYLEDVEGALWTLGVIEASRFSRFDPREPWRSLAVCWGPLAERFGRPAETFSGERRKWRTVVGVDPSGGRTECGIVVVAAPKNGRQGRDHAVVLDDASTDGPGAKWGAAVVSAYHRNHCDAAIVEDNYGGDQSCTIIHQIDPTVNVEQVHAGRAQTSNAKAERAEPVANLYEKGWVHHQGVQAALEDEMATWVPDESPESPNRVDALVHAVRHLLAEPSLGRASLPDQHALAARRL